LTESIKHYHHVFRFHLLVVQPIKIEKTNNVSFECINIFY